MQALIIVSCIYRRRLYRQLYVQTFRDNCLSHHVLVLSYKNTNDYNTVMHWLRNV